MAETSPGRTPDVVPPQRPEPPAADHDVSPESQRGLDWFTFFCANLQTGFGPFVSVYLTTAKWTQTDIGLVLTCGSVLGLLGQVPGGALVDAVRSKRLIAAISVIAIAASALFLALGSLFVTILFAWVLHALASCTLSPSITTMSLRLVGHGRINRRLGRNASFAAIGGAIAAAGMGACGYYISNQAVFFVTAALVVPALLALAHIDPNTAAPAPMRRLTALASTPELGNWRALITNRAIVVLAIAVALFDLANGAMLPLVASTLTLRSPYSPTILIAACIIIPQIMVAILSPGVGALAQRWGRRPLLIICFIALPLRGFCFSLTHDPSLLVATQVLDGVSASIFGVVIPLVAADATRRRGGFALAQGLIGTTMGLGAALSTSVTGFITDRYGGQTAFSVLAVVATLGLIVAWVAMPETRKAS
jgi:MFS family permease